MSIWLWLKEHVRIEHVPDVRDRLEKIIGKYPPVGFLIRLIWRF